MTKKTIQQHIIDYLQANPINQERQLDHIRTRINIACKTKISRNSFGYALMQLEEKGEIEKGYFVNLLIKPNK